MVSSYTMSFKEQAVRKVHSRAPGVSICQVAHELGINDSTLHGWMAKFASQRLNTISRGNSPMMASGATNEKRPQDWSLQERLEMVIRCGSLDDEAINLLCREQGGLSSSRQPMEAGFCY